MFSTLRQHFTRLAEAFACGLIMITATSACHAADAMHVVRKWTVLVDEEARSVRADAKALMSQEAKKRA